MCKPILIKYKNDMVLLACLAGAKRGGSKKISKRETRAWEGKRKQKVESANKLLFSWFFKVSLVDVRLRCRFKISSANHTYLDDLLLI